MSCKVKVMNSLGLHARPATAIVKLLQETKSSVSFTYHNETINAKSIMSILMLAAAKNSVIKVDIEGDDAEEVMNKLSLAFQQGFGE
ncbi:MAG: HPr family phosphocarrier protein [Chlamydiae bacterium]|nr:HPr family phosphocarrier protein [Chlamydiota bacterium]